MLLRTIWRIHVSPALQGWAGPRTSSAAPGWIPEEIRTEESILEILDRESCAIARHRNSRFPRKDG